MRGNDRDVLVAGATGLVGSAIVRRLLAVEPEASILAVHRFDAGCFIDDPRIRYLRADLTTRDGCAAAAAGCGRAVLAAASTGGVAQARHEPWRQVTPNVVMDSLLLEALYTAGAQRVVYVGSATVYQDLAGLIREDDLDWNIDPATAYMGVGWAKRYLEKQCAFWHRATGMEFAVIRAANVYGPWAQFDPSRSNFVAALIRKAADHMDPFEIWGSPEVTRDVIHADDFAEATVRMLLAGPPFDVYNLGSERKTTVGEVLDLALKWTDHHPREIRRLGDVAELPPFRVLDCTKARRDFGWAPKIGLEQGVQQTVEWWLAHKDTWTR